MTITTAGEVLRGIREVLVATPLATVNADFGSTHESVDDNAFARSAPRGLRVWPMSDVPLTDSSSHSYRRLSFEVGIRYPTDIVGEGVQAEDVRLYESRIRDLPALLAALDVPVADTRLARIEGFGGNMVRTDFAGAAVALTTFRVSIEYRVAQ